MTSEYTSRFQFLPRPDGQEKEFLYGDQVDITESEIRLKIRQRPSKSKLGNESTTSLDHENTRSGYKTITTTVLSPQIGFIGCFLTSEVIKHRKS